jgi:hypothetical protein
MPSMTNYLIFIFINLLFIAQIALMMYFRSSNDIKKNWPEYRCNPSYWIFSENLSEDFTYCVQNTQMSIMGYLLQPLNYLISNLTSISSGFSNSINNIRIMISFIRNFVTNIIESVFGVFLNLIIEFQRMIISIKDIVGKMLGIVMTILYILDGSIKTMGSAWNGPPGQLVKSIGSCFHPDTKVRLKNGQIYKMCDLPLDAELEDGSKIFSVMKISNSPDRDIKLFKINNGIDNEPIYVTGEHYILDDLTNKFIKVKEFKNASLDENVSCKWFSCLITTNNKIKIGKYTFWDWEDDILNSYRDLDKEQQEQQTYGYGL